MSPALPPNFSVGPTPVMIPSDPGGSAPPKKKKKKSTKRTGTSEAIVQLALELLAVSIFTLMAGASNDVGNVMVLLMVGFWLIYMIQNAKVIAGLERMLEAA